MDQKVPTMIPNVTLQKKTDFYKIIIHNIKTIQSQLFPVFIKNKSKQKDNNGNTSP